MIYLRILHRSFWCSLKTWFACWSPLFNSGAVLGPHGPARCWHQLKAANSPAAKSPTDPSLSLALSLALKARVNAYFFLPFIPPSIDSLSRKRTTGTEGPTMGGWGGCGPCIIIPIELCQRKNHLLSHTMQRERWQTCNKNTKQLPAG